MPINAGDRIVDTGVNMGVSRGLSELGLRSPVALPDFYAAGDPHPWANSQAMRILHGDRRALKQYGRRAAAGVIDTALMGTGVPGAINQGIKFVGGLIGRQWGLGNWITNGIANHTPRGEVTVGNINDTSGDFGGYQIDPCTGAPMRQFSNYGPYSAGYQGLDSEQPVGWQTPDYSTGDAPPEYNGPLSPEAYGLAGPMPSFNSGYHYSSAGGGSGAGTWAGGGGMRTIWVNPPQGGGIAKGRGKENGVHPN